MSRYFFLYGGAIGDTLFGVHLARMLADAAPGAQLTLISTRENSFVRQLVAPLPFVTLYELPKGRLGSWIFLLRLVAAPNRVTFWEPFSGHVSLWWRILLFVMTLQSGSIKVRCTINHSSEPHAMFCDCRNDRIFDMVPRILKEWGVVANPIQPHLDAALYKSSRALPAKPYIAFHFFAPSVRRSYPVSKAREVLTAVRAKFPHHKLVLTCASGDVEKAEQIVKGLDAEICANLVVKDLVQLISGASAYVGVDTGITHIACHVGVQCVVLGNLSNPCWLPYYAPNATVLFERARCECKGDGSKDCAEVTAEGTFFKCMYDIPTKSVVDALAL